MPTTPTPKQALVAHLREHHHRFKPADTSRRTLAELQRWHGHEHHHFPQGLRHFHAGPNEGSWLRPDGWKTGGDVVARPGLTSPTVGSRHEG